MYHCIKRRSWSTRAVFVLPACVTGVTRALPVTLETVQPLRTDALLAALARVSRLTQTLSAHMIALGTVHTATRLSAAHTERAHRTLILAPAHTHTSSWASDSHNEYNHCLSSVFCYIVSGQQMCVFPLDLLLLNRKQHIIIIILSQHVWELNVCNCSSLT